MNKFIKIPNGIIREDSIKRVIKYERDRYEGGTYYGVKIEEEITHNYEELDRGGVWNNGQKERRDEIYNDIIKQLSENEPRKDVNNSVSKDKIREGITKVCNRHDYVDNDFIYDLDKELLGE